MERKSVRDHAVYVTVRSIIGIARTDTAKS